MKKMVIILINSFIKYFLDWETEDEEDVNSWATEDEEEVVVEDNKKKKK